MYEAGGATTAFTPDRTDSYSAARPAEAQPGQNARGDSDRGWATSHMVLVAVTAFAFGVLVGCYPHHDREYGTGGLTRVSGMYLNIAGNLLNDVLAERKQKRRAANAQPAQRASCDR